MKQFKLSILLAILMSMVRIDAFASWLVEKYDIEVDGFYYLYNGTGLTLTYKGYYNTGGFVSGYTGNVVIPESVTYNGKTYKVTEIGWYAFQDCTGLTSITIPNSVTGIGDSAFYGCSGLTSVTIGNGVQGIGVRAFEGCEGLKEVHISDVAAWCNIMFGDNIFNANNPYYYAHNPLYYAHHLYLNEREIKDLIIPSDVTSISRGAFVGLNDLNSATIPNSVKIIGDGAFLGCSSLTSVTIGNNVTNIGSDAFEGCEGLKEIHISDIAAWCNIAFKDYGSNPLRYAHHLYLNGVEVKDLVIDSTLPHISKYAFCGCSGLESVTIMDGIFIIDSDAFISTIIPTLVFRCNTVRNKYSIPCKAIIIGEEVTTIGNDALGYVKSLTIGAGVLSIGKKAAYSTKTIWLTNTPPSGYDNVSSKVNYVSNDLYTSLSNIKVYPFLSSMFMVDGVKYVPVSPSERTCDAIDCLYDESAKNIHIGKTVSYKGVSMTVKDVNSYAFIENDKIEQVLLEYDGNIGFSAFYECAGIVNIVVNNSGTIGTAAFSSCSQLLSAQISNQGSIGERAFADCTSLHSAQISNQGTIGESAFMDCISMESATLGSEISSIGGSAFYNCSSLQSIKIPDAVTSLGTSVFSGCKSLQSAKVGSGVKNIPESTFYNCISLTDVQIGRNVETIGQSAFYGCSSLPKIEIPASVMTIQNDVFTGCRQLSTVIMKDKESILKLGYKTSSPYSLFADCLLDSVYIGRNITYETSSNRGYSPFYRNTSLRSVTITDKETEISENEFYGCAGLKNVRIGNGVTTIGNWAFSGCSSLDYFAFGASVETIGQEAFSDCTAMTSLISSAKTPPTCGTQALDDINKWNCTLQVPKGSLSAYQAAPQWKEFFFINDVVTGINNLDSKNDAEHPFNVYDLNGRKVLHRVTSLEGLPNGVYIVNGKKVVK